MKELQEILKRAKQFAPGEQAILATVVDVTGSGYRRPGARMLIDQKGYSIGTVSGGCLEADVLERAKKVLQTGQATVITYDTTTNEDSVFGFGMGCRGIVRILLEPIEKGSFLVEGLEVSFAKRDRQLMATVVSSVNDLPVGGRIYFTKTEQFNFEGFPDVSEIEPEVFKDCEKLFYANAGSLINTYRTEKGEFEVFFEVINPPVTLLLFGAGYDAVPLADFAKNLGWNISIIDHRPAWATAERFPQSNEIIVARPDNLNESLFRDENSVAVVMTHNYESDSQLLPRLLNSECLYIGALGPKKRTERILEESGLSFTEEQLSRLYAPIGLDIGAETPEEIALAIISEIKTALAKKNGGFLRAKNGGIHQ